MNSNISSQLEDTGGDPALRFRHAVRQYFGDKRATHYPAALKQRAVQHWQQRNNSGAKISAVALELGLDPTTLRAWVENNTAAESPNAIFERVQVLQAQPNKNVFVVHGAAGIRIEGLSIEQAAQLLRSASCLA
jgi:transposase-like protein